MSDVCEKHEVFGCTMCSGRDAAERRRAQWERDHPVFPAGYTGRCRHCGDRIDIDDPIRILEVDRIRGPVHESCSEECE